jgi:hypothetical protein
MPRYYFHLRSPTRPVRDKTGVKLSRLEAAHWHAMRLAYRLREHAAEAGEDWVIAVADERAPRRSLCCQAPFRCCASRPRRRSKWQSASRYFFAVLSGPDSFSTGKS